MSEPWKTWIPGVLSKPQVKELIERGFLSGADSSSVGLSAIDLHLSREVYKLNEGSIKPCRDRYSRFLKKYSERFELDGDNAFELSPKSTYLFKLKEKLEELKGSPIYGRATAKSSVGRVDVLSRLVVDGQVSYEEFIPGKIGTGDMYLEVTPITFPVRVKEGISLSQLRLFVGDPSLSEVKGKLYNQIIVRNSNEPDGLLSVDLTDTDIRNLRAAAFCAKENFQAIPVDLWKNSENKPNPCDYWRLCKTDSNDADDARLTITKDAFYILRSKERLAVPRGIAVYCQALDETIGEMRIHYAGFAHPFFGLNRKDGVDGTPLIFEVRGHDVDVNLIHGEKMARLTFYRMSEDADIKDAKQEDSQYNDQNLKLSNFFADWPSQLKCDENGGVSSADE